MIPEISVEQVTLMHGMIEQERTQAVIRPVEKLDPPHVFREWVQTNKEIDGLVELGMIEEVTHLTQDTVEMLSKGTGGRDFRIFLPTTHGKLMFQHMNSRAVN